MTKFKPKKYGHPAINIVCAECGKMFSEQQGHDCKDNEGYY